MSPRAASRTAAFPSEIVSSQVRPRQYRAGEPQHEPQQSVWFDYVRFALHGSMSAMKLLLRILIPAVALYVAHLLISGIQINGGSDAKKAGTLIIIALIFGVVNAVLKPIIKTIGCLFYILTLGLIGLVVNGALLYLCSWIAAQVSLPFHITSFMAAFWGAIIVGIVGWLLNLIFDDHSPVRRVVAHGQ